MCQDRSWVDSVWFRACFVTTGDTKVASSDSCYKLWYRVAVFYNMYKCGSLLTYICDVKVEVSRFKIWYSAAWPLLWYKTAIAEFIYVKQCGLFHDTKVYDTGGRKGCASWWKQGWWGGGQCQLDPLIFFHLGKPSEIQKYRITRLHKCTFTRWLRWGVNLIHWTSFHLNDELCNVCQN